MCPRFTRIKNARARNFATILSGHYTSFFILLSVQRARTAAIKKTTRSQLFDPHCVTYFSFIPFLFFPKEESRASFSLKLSLPYPLFSFSPSFPSYTFDPDDVKGLFSKTRARRSGDFLSRARGVLYINSI